MLTLCRARNADSAYPAAILADENQWALLMQNPMTACKASFSVDPEKISIASQAIEP